MMHYDKSRQDPSYKTGDKVSTRINDMKRNWNLYSQ
jgi:hypothetical protein